ncbi:MAG: hypothetical protein GY845_01085 [Planctomycetes bacterium]|nr:hypothetical protein [Planctomycetota bacterium]
MQKRKTKQDTRLKKHNPGHITFISVLWSVACGLLLAGCAEQQQYQAAESLLMENTDKLQVMEAAEDVLVNMYFTIEKANAENGFIRTRPLQGAQFFELWRSDNVGTDNWLSNNLHSVRRIVELNISEQGKDLNINCDVEIFRLSLPEREIRSAHAYDLFSVSSSVLQRIQLHPEQKEDMAWIDLGKDEQLAAEILKQIEQQIVSGQTASNQI